MEGGRFCLFLCFLSHVFLFDSVFGNVVSQHSDTNTLSGDTKGQESKMKNVKDNGGEAYSYELPSDILPKDHIPFGPNSQNQQHNQFSEGPRGQTRTVHHINLNDFAQGQSRIQQLMRDAQKRILQKIQQRHETRHSEQRPLDGNPPIQQFRVHYHYHAGPQNQQHDQHHEGDHFHSHQNELVQIEPSTKLSKSDTEVISEIVPRTGIKPSDGLPDIKGDVRFANIQAESLKAHNDARRRVQPAAANMLEMTWNDELAAVAQNYANKCKLSHNKNRNDEIKSFIYIGENLFMCYPFHNITIAIEDWEDEKKFYKFESNSCTDVCGHYTQVVWHDTDQVGCALSSCPVFHKKAIMVVCNYGPGGNIVGKKPYEPGKPCSKCPTGTTCKNGLCSKDIH